MCIYIYIHMYLSIYLSIYLSLYIYTYIHTYCVVLEEPLIWPRALSVLVDSIIKDDALLREYLSTGYGLLCPKEHNTRWTLSFQHTNSGAGLQFMLLGRVAKAHVKGVVSFVMSALIETPDFKRGCVCLFHRSDNTHAHTTNCTVDT